MLLKIKKEEKKKRKKKRFSLIIILVDFSSGTTRISVLPVPVLNTVPYRYRYHQKRKKEEERLINGLRRSGCDHHQGRILLILLCSNNIAEEENI